MWWTSTLVGPGLVLLSGLAVIGWAVRKKPETPALVLFGGLVLTASLMSPIVTTTMSQWQALLLPRVGTRYFFIPVVAWLTVVTLVAFQGRGIPPGIAVVALLMTLTVGVPTDLILHKDTNKAFAMAARNYDTASSGVQIQIPVEPDATMTLVK